MTFDMMLVAKGLREPLLGVLQQARYHAELAQLHAEQLAEKTWTPADTNSLIAATNAVDNAKAKQIDERSDAYDNTRAQAAAVSQAKTLIQKFRYILPLVLSDNDGAVDDVDRKDFAVPGRQLGRSPTAVSAYLNQISPALAKLDPHLAPYFDGQQFSVLIAEAKRKLDHAAATQDLSTATLPEEALAVQEQKGRLLKLIDRLNAIGQLRFHGDATISGRFNRDILLAARKKRPAAPKPVEPPTT